MGKKLYGVLTPEEMFAQANTNATETQIKYFESQDRAGVGTSPALKNAYSRLLGEKISKKAPQKELDDIVSKIKKEQEVQAVYEEAEKKLEIADRVSKLTPENQSIYQSWKVEI